MLNLIRKTKIDYYLRVESIISIGTSRYFTIHKSDGNKIYKASAFYGPQLE